MSSFRTHTSLLPLVVVMSFGTIASASTQALDRLRYGGNEYSVFETPMTGLWHYGKGKAPTGKTQPPAFEVNSSNNWGGYFAKWEVHDKKLLLRSIRGRINGHKVRNDAILKDRVFPVHATWFTGRIHLPVGDYVDEKQEWESVIVFDVENGNVKSTTFLESGKIPRSWNGLP